MSIQATGMLIKFQATVPLSVHTCAQVHGGKESSAGTLTLPRGQTTVA